MPRMMTVLERHQAERDLDLARRQAVRSRRLLRTLDLSPVTREQVAADIDDFDREAAMLETLLASNERPGWSMSRFAGPNHGIEECPYQQGGA